MFTLANVIVALVALRHLCFLALAVALREVKRLPHHPTRDEQQALAADRMPWRAVAARMLWAHYLEARGQYFPAT